MTETNPSRDVVIDTPEGMAHFQMAQAIARLRLETRTGMKSSRGSTLQMVRQHYGVVAGTKAKALAIMEAKYEATYGRKYGAKTEDTRLFMDTQGGRIVCFKHLGGYGKADVEAYPNGTSKTVDGRRQWITPLDVWMQMEQPDLDAMKKMGYEAECEECRNG